MAGGPRGSERQLSLVLDTIHQVPFGESTWDSALAAIADFLGAECADLTFSDPVQQKLTRWEQARLDTQTVEEYTRTYMAANWAQVQPRVPIALGMRQGQVVADIDFWDASARKRMMFFQEYYHPLVQCGECLMGCVSKTEDEPWAYLAPHFRSRAPQQALVRERLGMLLPHVRRAITAETRLQIVNKEKEALAEALDHVADAVALLDRGGKVVRANRAAEALLRNAGGVDRAADGRLLVSTSQARTALAAALAQCTSPLLWTPGAGVMPPVRITVSRPQGRSLILTLQPLPKELSGAFNAVALLFIADPDGRPVDRSAALRKAYKLSPGEAQLVQAIAGGETLKEFAVRNQVSYETVRSQLRRCFEKTGVRRQAELVPLVLRTK